MRPIVRKLLLLVVLLLGCANIICAQSFLDEPQTLWPVIADHFVGLSSEEGSANVQKQIDRYLRDPKYIHRVSENARPYLYYIYQETKKYHLPAELALLPMIESDYKPHCYSSAGAVGLWQLMPDTAHGYGVQMNSWYDGRRSTTVSTKVALTFLSYLYEQFHHNWLLTLAAYDSGPGTVMAAIRYNKERNRPTNFWSLPLPKETKAYVPKLLAMAAIVEHPNPYGIRLAKIPNQPIASTVTIQKQMKITTIAHLANTSVSTVKTLNPALKTSTTPPHQKITLMLPINKKTKFTQPTKTQIKTPRKENHWEPSTLKHGNDTSSAYIVQPGDNLHTLAEHHHTTTAALIQKNHLHTSVLQVGQHLVL